MISPKPKLSVVMGCCNGGALLSATLDSVLSQQGVAFEFVIVDDGSTDDSRVVLERYAREDSRISLERVHQNQGLTKALIRGCELARGEYIARQDVGDVSLPGRFSRQVEILDRNPDTVLASCNFSLVGPRGEILEEAVTFDGAAVTQGLRKPDPEHLVGPHHGTVMFRKSAYQAAGGYRKSFYYAQDLDLWTRIVDFGGIEFTPEVLYQVRFNHDSITAQFGGQQRQLRSLIARAAHRRDRGEPEDDLLEQAATLARPVQRKGVSSRAVAGADYFIGSCLLARRDPAAGQYLRSALKRRPFSSKTWAKLLLSYATRRLAS